MELGVVFPQTEIGSDPDAIRGYAVEAERLGYRYLAAFDHVLGANPERPGGWAGPYTHATPFHEIVVLLAHLAAVTTTLDHVAEVLVLPQRQTALVAKQAASLDLLSGGRLRLGVGIGWNRVEYEALGERFGDRARRVEAQVALLRRLWSEPLVTVDDGWHRISDAGINPLPPRRSIPVWMGGTAEPALARAARIADGLMVNVPLEAAGTMVPHVRALVREAGRDEAAFEISGRVSWRGEAAPVVERLQGWERLGASHAAVTTMGAGLTEPVAHVAALTAVMEAWTAR